MPTICFDMKPYIQPFEKELALQELATVAGVTADRLTATDESSMQFKLSTSKEVGFFAERLAYWETISSGNKVVPTTQALREATINIVRNGIDLGELPRLLPFKEQIPLPNRRCLRYGTHGIHEYRGKFFPQLVRSLINIAGLKKGAVVADPMSGSGTTVVESVLYGATALGIDMNPLSVMMAKTKADLLYANPESLSSAYLQVRSRLLSCDKERKPTLKYFSELGDADKVYLSQWFAQDVLAGLDEIASTIEEVNNDAARNLMYVSLSNIIRRVSWQKDDDLRVRKDVRLDVEKDPKKEFLEELGRSVRAILAFLYQNAGDCLGTYKVVEGDARECATIWSDYREQIDAVITSPPYATALPYLDTDRLSLYYMGLLSRAGHRDRDQLMIGNREVSDRIRKRYWQRFEEQGNILPQTVCSLITRIHDLNSGTDVGFRRKNLSALLAKYFFDMTEVMIGIREVLRPGGHAFVVVGNNHTIAGGHRVDICTAQLLLDIATKAGLEPEPSLAMDMLVSRDIFRKNAMSSEEILFLRKG